MLARTAAGVNGAPRTVHYIVRVITSLSSLQSPNVRPTPAQPKVALRSRIMPAHATQHLALQQLLDAAAEQGHREVRIPAGEYLMGNALQLRSGLHIIADGDVLLKKAPHAASLMTHFHGYGHFEVGVENPDLFDIGDGIFLRDENAVGFYTTVATVVDKIKSRGETLLIIDRMFNHDYHPNANAVAARLHSLIEGVGVEDVLVEGIRLDGAAEDNVNLNGCRGAGVFLIQSKRVGLRNVEVANYHGDAISFQQCIDIAVTDCNLHDNRGGGLHPGSGSIRYALTGNTIKNNGNCGVFYCLRTTHSVCENNTIHDNGSDGISIGERDTDHLIAGNDIQRNGGAGVSFREPTRISGDRVIVRGNRMSQNGRTSPGAEIKIPAGLRDIHIEGNSLQPRDGQPAIFVEPGSERISIGDDNTVADAPLAATDVKDDACLVHWGTPTALPPVGPAELGSDGGRHLGPIATELMT